MSLRPKLTYSQQPCYTAEGSKLMAIDGLKGCRATLSTSLLFSELSKTTMAYLQVANSRGGLALILDNFRYLRNKTRDDRVYWRCTRCNTWVHTGLIDFAAEDPPIAILRQPGAHDHAAEDDLVATTALIELMFQHVAADPTVPVRRVRLQRLID